MILGVAAAMVLPLLSVWPTAAAPPPDPSPVPVCESLTSLSLGLTGANVTVEEAVLETGDDATPKSCRVRLSISHPEAGDEIDVWVGLPVNEWNGRFQAVGGGGFSGGTESSLNAPLQAGYATAATDGGHPGSNADFVYNADGTLNWQQVENFSHLAIHEMTVTAKDVVAAYYGTAPQYSYFNGWSTGGRQGLAEAQRYPSDFDGILTGAPVINWSELQVLQIWGQVVMNEEDNFIPACKFAAATAAAVEACDTIGDGVDDGVIGNPGRCEFDPEVLVGTSTACGEITAADVDVIRKIWEGPRGSDGEFLWYGLTSGTDLTGLNGTAEVDGELVGQPFAYPVDWIRYWVLQDPDWDWTELTY